MIIGLGGHYQAGHHGLQVVDRKRNSIGGIVFVDLLVHVLPDKAFPIDFRRIVHRVDGDIYLLINYGPVETVMRVVSKTGAAEPVFIRGKDQAGDITRNNQLADGYGFTIKSQGAVCRKRHYFYQSH